MEELTKDQLSPWGWLVAAVVPHGLPPVGAVEIGGRWLCFTPCEPAHDEEGREKAGNDCQEWWDEVVVLHDVS